MSDSAQPGTPQESIDAPRTAEPDRLPAVYANFVRVSGTLLPA